MKIIYVVCYDGQISTEGYLDVHDAMKFIENRSGNPKPIMNWKYQDKYGGVYTIHAINVR